MSQFVNSAYTTDQGGRQSNIIFGRNKYGYFVKLFKPSVNPRTVSQQEVRAFMKTAAKAWATLTDAQRIAYNNISATIEYVKKGQTYTLPGFNFFMKLNRNLQDIGEPFCEDISEDSLVSPPTMIGSSVDIVTTPGTEDIKLFIPAALDAKTKGIVSATPPLKSSCKTNWMRLRAIMTIDGTFVNGGSIKTQYLAKFGTLPNTGNKVGFAVMPVDIGCGMENSKVYMLSVGTI